MLETITIQEIINKRLLPEIGIDKRTIKKWLAKHKVDVFGTNRKLVFSVQFERAKVEERIGELKKKYGDKWLTVLQTELVVYSRHKETIQQASIFKQYPQQLSEVVISPALPKLPLDVSSLLMENNLPIELPKNSKQYPGIHVWCKKCRTTVSPNSVCPESKKSIQKCNDGSLGYKLILHDKTGNIKSRFTKLIDAKTFDEALQAQLDFKNEKFGNKDVAPIQSDRMPIKQNVKDYTIEKLMDEYFDFLQNKGVPAHLQVIRSEMHIKDIKRVFKDFKDCLVTNGYNALSVSKLDDNIVGLYHEHLLKVKEFQNRTYNKHISLLTTFTSWAQGKNKAIDNPFDRVKHRPITPKANAINKDQFEKLIKAITPENGIHISQGTIKEKRNYYYSYLKDAFKCALYTGARRQELANLKFSSVIEDDLGNPAILKVEDFKVNHIQHRTDQAERRYHHIPVNRTMSALLNDLGYLEYKKTDIDRYIIAPEISFANRDKTLSEIFSRCFAHFNEKAGNDSNLSFGSLRKRYITSMQITTHGSAKEFTHNSNGVLEHYLDKEALANAARNFEVFPESYEKRNKELSEVRNPKQINQVIER